jgi:anti-sigma factor ChrR (cupin superfamily)
MRVHANFDEAVRLHASDVPWVPSPMPGVERRMLDRIGDEVARATSFVRYAPGSQFSPHVHGGGEEFIVLEGVFEDEHGAFGAGSYIRNPPTSKHTPGSAPGCVIFVKLWQFDPADRQTVRLDMNALDLSPEAPGIEAATLFEDDRETVRLERWTPGTQVHRTVPDGAEILVLDGALQSAEQVWEQHAWWRLPRGARLLAQAGSEGARVWIKTRHLRFVDPPTHQP